MVFLRRAAGSLQLDEMRIGSGASTTELGPLPSKAIFVGPRTGSAQHSKFLCARSGVSAVVFEKSSATNSSVTISHEAFSVRLEK
jgi:hypothetical protein